ncbi:hypothetical protein B0T20DRAFT_388228 [Sordaria brevicollis]|uniref:Uncharacterized protein n=1 Tax=Sordaria brevicollis TaxID=83679 RepID=A0AAE0UFN0_SORBR|nr:hypothetical protein B0T20DRAFT_388228 [Sordaria brevicollis]
MDYRGGIKGNYTKILNDLEVFNNSEERIVRNIIFIEKKKLKKGGGSITIGKLIPLIDLFRNYNIYSYSSNIRIINILRKENKKRYRCRNYFRRYFVLIFAYYVYRINVEFPALIFPGIRNIDFNKKVDINNINAAAVVLNRFIRPIINLNKNSPEI